MSHRALTLKYRPQVFADMVAQDHVSLVLERALESGRIAHAYLFAGPRGVGKTTSARILAKALNCERRAAGPHPGQDPCNECTSCVEITNGVSLDVAEIDGASNRGIADVQALRERVRFSPTGGRFRVVIIDEVHQLSNDAFAALLKTLEEPPAHLVFLFATTDPQKLPDTIRSRTQRFDFARVPPRKVAERLMEIAAREGRDPNGVNFSLSEGAALLIARKSEGALRDAVSALDQVVSSGETNVDEEAVRRVLGIADREAFFALAEAIVKRDPQAALRTLHQAFEKGLEARDLAEGLSEHIRHILILQVDPRGEDLVPVSSEDLKRLREQGEGWSENDLLRLLRIASEAMGPMRDSPQPLIHIEAAVMQMATLEPGDSLAALIERLESLERRLEGGSATAAPAGRAGSEGGSRAVPGASRAHASARSRAIPGGSPAGSDSPPGDRAEFTRQGRGSVPAEPPGFGPAHASIPPAVGGRSGVALAGGTHAATATVEATRAPDDEAQRQWQDLVAGVYARKRMLGAFLEESRFVGATGGHLTLAMDDLHRAVIEEKANRTIVTEEIRRVFGRPLEIRCESAAAERPSRVGEDVNQMIERTIAWFHGEAVAPRPPERTEG